jgi:chromosome segregation ATPase
VSNWLNDTGYQLGYRAAIETRNQNLIDRNLECQALRQAVKNLIANNEKLRQINQQAIRHALDGDARIQRQAQAVDTLTAENDGLRQQLTDLNESRRFLRGRCSDLMQEISAIKADREFRNLQTELERTAAQLKASSEENGKLERERADMQRFNDNQFQIIALLEREKAAQYLSAKSLRCDLQTAIDQRDAARALVVNKEQELNQLQKDRGFLPQDQKRLWTIIHAAAEIIHGGEVESIRISSPQ